MTIQVRRISRKITEIIDSLSFPKFLFLNILTTGLLLVPLSKFTLFGYIEETIKLGVAYGWFVFLMALLYSIIDVPEKWEVSIHDWIASFGAFSIITSLILWKRQWPVALKVLIVILLAYLWTHLTIKVLQHIQTQEDIE
ncbi:hypothetical protein APY94_08310 [Thermococcus celericrescens]|uniref:Uncharacterized protein n=1 Tax=Thermococcus celericrescens TaxID=227598 RepID=A0A117ITE4_9EURY|nr:hypothetical protein [Thermococcus celericrescens]KUH32779.1 hypothetical protein APY94_08310 [Thermococcus celericrescens]